MEPNDRLIVALDVSSLEEIGLLIDELAPYVGCFKVGLQMLTSCGAPRAVDFIHQRGRSVFLDGKFCDIPNTVGQAAKAAAALGVKMFNVHASCGMEAMKAAVANKGDSLVLAVTVLTSLDDHDVGRIFGESSSWTKVRQFAYNAHWSGCDGVICSPQELRLLDNEPPLLNLARVTPGVRPVWAAAGDQKRVMTPGEAVKAGADYLVIGRPITKPPAEIGAPADAAKKITEEISAVLQEGR